MVFLQHDNLIIRTAMPEDAEQLILWWNDGSVMAHAGFPNGLGTTAEKERLRLPGNRLIIEEAGRPIGECNARGVGEGAAEIGIKICETDCQNRGVGRMVLSMLIGHLFSEGYDRIILDTNLNDLRAQHVYEKLGFRKLRVNIDSWFDQLGRPQSSVDYELTRQDFCDFTQKH